MRAKFLVAGFASFGLLAGAFAWELGDKTVCTVEVGPGEDAPGVCEETARAWKYPVFALGLASCAGAGALALRRRG